MLIWLAVFFLTFYTAIDDLDIFERLIASGLLSAVTLFYPSSKRKTTASKSSKTLYIFEGNFGNKPVYRICNNKVYVGLSNKYRYEIKGDKIYPPVSSKPIFQIKGNRIYKVLDPKVAYRIDGNKVYKGELGNIPVYRISNSPNGR